MEEQQNTEATVPSEAERGGETPRIIDEIQVEELAIDGICGVY